MVVKQCKFTDFEGTTHGGLYIFSNGQAEDPDNDYIICGCCGAIFRLEDIESYGIYPSWVDISSEIMGE